MQEEEGGAGQALLFFECIAAGMDHRYEPGYIRDQCVLHFARIVFDASAASLILSIDDALRFKGSISASRVTLAHPSVRVWYKKIMRQQRSPPMEDFFPTHLKLLKTMALRFVLYHRDYESKPRRLFSLRMFAQLVCDVFRVNLCFNQTRWFYPLDEGDYFINIDTKTIHLFSTDSSGTFKLQAAAAAMHHHTHDDDDN